MIKWKVGMQYVDMKQAMHMLSVDFFCCKKQWINDLLDENVTLNSGIHEMYQINLEMD